MIDERNVVARRFPVELSGTKEEKSFLNRALKEYLKGNKYFKFHGQYYKVPVQNLVLDE